MPAPSAPASRLARVLPLVLAAGLALTLVPLGSLHPAAHTVAWAEPSSQELREQARTAQERLDELEEAQSLAVERYLQAEEAAQAVQARIEEIEAELRALDVDLDTLTVSTNDHVRRMHVHGPTLELSLVFIAGDLNDASARAATLRRILASQQVDLASLEATRVTVAALEAELRDRHEAAAASVATLAERRDEVEATIQAQQAEIAELEERIAAAVAREEEERRRREQERLRREAEERRRAEQEAARQAAAAANSSNGGSSSSSSGGSSSSGSSSSSGGSSSSSPASAPAARQSAQVAVDTALAQLGKPYQWGGNGPGSFDCSGLTTYAWRAAGVSLPRSSRAQYGATTRVSRGSLQPGDLVFYHQPISHVALYIGGGRVVEAPNAGNVVRIRHDGLTRRGVVGFGRP